jgi:hypothetical protein
MFAPAPLAGEDVTDASQYSAGRGVTATPLTHSVPLKVRAALFRKGSGRGDDRPARRNVSVLRRKCITP